MNNDNEVLVKVDGVSKKFCRDLKKSLWYGMCDVANELLPIQNSKFKIKNSEDALRPGEFWANKDISFELRRGECIGLIGHNGAGKTTLLKMLNGLIKPDEGTIEMRGRVGALIALGAGFNPILTGRENIYVNGSILGLTKEEIDAKIDDIIDFAEISDFIDSPVQSYSSGMTVRLGFAVATAMNPDILILDEVLAVGDRRFRSKCMTRISKILEHCAVIFVSHSSADIQQICDNVVWLDKGQLKFIGEVEAGLKLYSQAYQNFNQASVNVLDPVLSAQLSCKTTELHLGDSLVIKLKINLSEEVIADYFVGAIVAETGETIAQFHPPWQTLKLSRGHGHIEFSVLNLRLAPGKYTLNALCCANGGKRVLFHLSQVSGFLIEGGAHLWSSYQPETI